MFKTYKFIYFCLPFSSFWAYECSFDLGMIVTWDPPEPICYLELLGYELKNIGKYYSFRFKI